MHVSKLLMVALVVLATCSDLCRRVEGFTVENRTEHNLLFVWLHDSGDESTLNLVTAGTTQLVASFGCIHPVVARLEDGTEFTRTEAEICNGDTWVIEDP